MSECFFAPRLTVGHTLLVILRRSLSDWFFSLARLTLDDMDFEFIKLRSSKLLAAGIYTDKNLAELSEGLAWR